MQLNDTLARQIVSRAMKILSFSVNVMDEHGLIIASGNPERLHQRHEGAVLALTENRVVEISDATARELKGVRPGINLPIAYQGELLGVIGISGDPDEVRAYAELVRMTAELILEQAARFLGLDLAQPRVVAVLALEEADPARLRELVHLLENPERDNLVAINGLDEIVVLKPAQLSDGIWQSEQERSRIKQLLARIPHFRVRIGVGDYFAGTGGLARSYQTARDTLRRGMRQAPRKQVYFFEDYRLPVLLGSLADSWQADQLRAPLHKLAQEDTKGTLLKTLRQYFLQDCDLHPCAEALFIHPNTLRYRLTRIEQITGLNFNKLDDKFLLYLGLNLDS